MQMFRLLLRFAAEEAEPVSSSPEIWDLRLGFRIYSLGFRPRRANLLARSLSLSVGLGLRSQDFGSGVRC